MFQIGAQALANLQEGPSKGQASSDALWVDIYFINEFYAVNVLINAFIEFIYKFAYLNSFDSWIIDFGFEFELIMEFYNEI